MTKQTEALKMAIEAMEDAYSNSTYWETDMSQEEFLKRIQACKEALEQPLTRDWKETINERIVKDDAFKQALEQPAQEPVAWTSTKALQNAKLLGAGDLWLEFDENYAMDAKEIGSKSKQIPLYTHPAPSWQGLSGYEYIGKIPLIVESNND